MNQKLHNLEFRILDDALAALKHTTALNTVILNQEPKALTRIRPDAEIQIETNGKRFRYFVEIKTVDRAIALAAAKNQLAPHGDRGMLVTRYLTAELANHCRNKLDLQFIAPA